MASQAEATGLALGELAERVEALQELLGKAGAAESLLLADLQVNAARAAGRLAKFALRLRGAVPSGDGKGRKGGRN
jgi:hypothetical protein